MRKDLEEQEEEGEEKWEGREIRGGRRVRGGLRGRVGGGVRGGRGRGWWFSSGSGSWQSAGQVGPASEQHREVPFIQSSMTTTDRYYLKAWPKATSGFQTCCQTPRKEGGITCQSLLSKGPHQLWSMLLRTCRHEVFQNTQVMNVNGIFLAPQTPYMARLHLRVC